MQSLWQVKAAVATGAMMATAMTAMGAWPSWAAPTAAVGAVLLVDYSTVRTNWLGHAPTVWGRRVPVGSFLAALVLTETPLYAIPLLKAVIATLAWHLGASDLWWAPYAAAISVLSSLVHATLYVRAAYDAKRLAEETVASFSDEGPLNSRDGPQNWKSPLAMIARWCTVPQMPHSAYGLDVIEDISYALPKEKLEDAALASYLTLNIYRSQRAASKDGKLRPVFVYIHGGAWQRGLGGKADRMPVIYQMASLDWVAVSIDYRLWPNKLWPAYIVDCKRAIRFIKQNIAEYGGDPNMVIVSGGSAGGHLASLIALTGMPEYNVSSWQPDFEDVDTSVHGCVAWYPACNTVINGVGVPLENHWWSKYTGRPFAEDLHREASPVHHTIEIRERVAKGDLDHTLCPFLVIQGEADCLVPATVVRPFAHELDRHPQKASPCLYVEFPKAHHSFDALSSPRAFYACGIVARFCREVLKDRKHPHAGAGC